jgi:hypothetical protein
MATRTRETSFPNGVAMETSELLTLRSIRNEKPIVVFKKKKKKKKKKQQQQQQQQQQHKHFNQLFFFFFFFILFVELSI